MEKSVESIAYEIIREELLSQSYKLKEYFIGLFLATKNIAMDSKIYNTDHTVQENKQAREANKNYFSFDSLKLDSTKKSEGSLPLAKMIKSQVNSPDLQL